MLPKERIAELSLKCLKIADEIASESSKTHDLKKLNYNCQQMIVLKKFAKIFCDISMYHTLNGDYLEED